MNNQVIQVSGYCFEVALINGANVLDSSATKICDSVSFIKKDDCYHIVYDTSTGHISNCGIKMYPQSITNDMIKEALDL